MPSRTLPLIVSLSALMVTISVGLVRQPLGQERPLGLADLTLINVNATEAPFRGKPAIKLELTDAVQKSLFAQQALDNVVALALLPGEFGDGTLEVELAGELSGRGRPDARAFVGLAFHALADGSSYEAVYLRMTNGRLAVPTPPVPRIDRAIQYVAHPEFHFAVSRDKFPEVYERGANIGPGLWTRLRLVIDGSRLEAYVGDEREPALRVADLKRAGRRGRVGLLIDDGTSGYFTNLSIRPRGL
ncbi:MAG: hypothetical protein AB7I50_14945 [Vicinamibacterales bacterium]